MEREEKEREGQEHKEEQTRAGGNGGARIFSGE